MMASNEPLLLRSQVKKEEDLCIHDCSPGDSSLYSPSTTGGLQLEVPSLHHHHHYHHTHARTHTHLPLSSYYQFHSFIVHFQNIFLLLFELIYLPDRVSGFCGILGRFFTMLGVRMRRVVFGWTISMIKFNHGRIPKNLKDKIMLTSSIVIQFVKLHHLRLNTTVKMMIMKSMNSVDRMLCECIIDLNYKSFYKNKSKTKTFIREKSSVWN